MKKIVCAVLAAAVFVFAGCDTGSSTDKSDVPNTFVPDDGQKPGSTDETGSNEVVKDIPEYLIVIDTTVLGIKQGFNPEHIDIPDGITKIDDRAFISEHQLKSVTIPDSVTEIGMEAFRNCSLENVTIPKKCDKIGESAFHHCGLESVTISDGVKEIGDRAFFGCNLRSVTIPGTVVSIGEEAFVENYFLNNVVIMDGVTKIGDSAFCGNRYLGSVTIPASVTSIGKGAFAGSCITSVTIPDGITEIDDYTFSGCTELKTVYIPRSVKAIAVNIDVFNYSSAFSKCKIEDVFYGGTKEEWCQIKAKKGDDYSRLYLDCSFSEGKELYYYEVTRYYIDEAGDGSESLSIPEYLKVHGTVVKGVKSEFKETITHIVIPEGITELGENVFYGCTQLRSVIIPDSVTKICGMSRGVSDEDIQFALYYEGTDSEYMNIPTDFTIATEYLPVSKFISIKIDNGLAIEGTKLIGCMENNTNVAIPDSVTEIGEKSFYGHTSLKSVEIPETVTVIWSEAFSHCTSLEYIKMPDSVLSIGSNAFYDCTSLSSINLPCNIKYINDWVFDGCTALESIIIPDSVEVIRRCAFRNCSSLSEVEIPNSVIEIGNSAFCDCESLTNIVIPESVKRIETKAFWIPLLKEVSYKGTKAQWEMVYTWDNDIFANSMTTLRCSDGNMNVW